uniref:Uncharacterized protein n=1 Tax=Lepeophtheirus salmonis TaxID=72036 RepID=A0A0K2UNY3_LEPSM
MQFQKSLRISITCAVYLKLLN